MRAPSLLGALSRARTLPRGRMRGRVSRGAGRGCGTRRRGRGGVVRLGSPTHLVVCCFCFSPGGGGEGQPGSSGDPVCDVSFGRRGWKQAGTSCKQIAGFPSPCLCWGLITCGWRGESLALGSPARTAGWVEGNGAPGGFVQPCGQRAGPDGSAVEAAGRDGGGGGEAGAVQPHLPLAALPTLGLEQDSGYKCCGRDRALRSSRHQEDGESWPQRPQNS